MRESPTAVEAPLSDCRYPIAPVLNLDNKLAWVISDKDGLRQRLLQQLGFRTQNIHHDLHSKGHCNRLLQALSTEQPLCLWVRLAGPCAGSGNKQDAARTSHLCALISAQRSALRMVIVEANGRSQVWNMRHVQSMLSNLCVTEHAWCRYESGHDMPCSTVVRLATSFQMQSKLCHCSPGTRRVDSKRLAGSKEERWSTVLSALASSAIATMQGKERHFLLDEAADSNQHRQPELSLVDAATSAAVPASMSEGMHFQTCSLEQAECMAKDLRKMGDASSEACYRLLSSTPFLRTHGARQIACNENGQSDCYAFGAFAHGGFAGVTKATVRHQELVRYLNFFLTSREKQLRWSSLSINNNNSMAVHRDVNNLKGTANIIICVGKYRGGGLWLELTDEVTESRVQYRKVGDQRLPGTVCDCYDELVVFDPCQLHGPEPWRGDRWSITGFTSRGFIMLKQHEVDQLKSFKFPVGGRTSNVALQKAERSVSSDVNNAAFPTEEAERRKAKMKAGHIIKPKKFVVEQSCDDLGDDLSSILEHTDCVAWTPHLLGAKSEKVDACDELEAELQAFIIGKYRWMHGSSMCKPMPRLLSRGFFNMEQFVSAKLPCEDDFVEVMEIFGGDATTTWILSKKHGVKTGWNFDLTVGVDLRKKSDVALLWQYLTSKRPKVVVIAPPCRCYGSLSHVNRVLNRDSFEHRYQNDKILVELAAQIAAFQMSVGNHFVAEQPVGSSMFESSEWLKHMRGRHVHEAKFDQCMVGLVERASGLPVKKPTRLISSSELIVCRFRSKRCQGHIRHANISSVGHSDRDRPIAKSRDMQVWPAAMCDLLARGIVECLTCGIDAFNANVYAADAKSKCPGCRWHKRMDHPSHDRSEHCKFPDVTPSTWSCPGCIKNRPRSDATHSLSENCQWNVARTMPEGLGRERKGGHPRDVRVPAAAEPTSALGEPSLRSVGSREVHAEDAEALRRRRARASSATPVVHRRDAAAQVSEGGVGVAAGPDEPMRPATAAPREARPVEAAGAEEDDAERWTAFDLGRALIDLRSLREGVVRRALRKLHVRWFHASAQKMKTLLTAAGVPQDIMVLVQQIVDTCDICRNWSRPGPRAVTSSTVTTRFNQEVQTDLLFYKDKVVLHMIDRTTRFTVARKVESKHLDCIIEGIMSHWVALFGPPNQLTSDQEGALSSPEAAALLEARGIKLHLLAKEQHATTVERHHAILRRQLHVLDEQATAEGLRVSFESLLGEAVFAKNALFSVGGASPFEAVFGRTPPLLGVVNAESGDSPDDRDCDRVRQLAINTIVQATAENKLRRADRGKSRMPGELLDLKVGDAVEFFRRATTKDAHSWFGPATVTDLTSILDGQIGIKWQGRLMICRTQDVRRALLFWCFLSKLPSHSPVAYLCEAAEDLRGDVVRLGWFKSKDSWIACEANQRFPRVLLAGLHVGSCALNLTGVVSFRLGSAATSLAAVACDDSFLLWWRPGNVSVWFHAYLPGNQHLNMQRITGLSDAAFVQYFCADSETVASLRQVVHDIPNVGGPFDPALPRLQDVTEQVHVRQRQRQLTIEDAPPFQPQRNTEHFDIHTPPVSEDQDAVEQADSVESMFARYVCHPPVVLSDEAYEDAFVLDPAELEESKPEIAFTDISSRYLVGLKTKVEKGELLIFNSGTEDCVIERTHNILSRQEALANADECRASMLKELARWHSHKAWVRTPRSQCTNILSSRWVLKWKQIQGTKQIKSRMVVQGFKDTQSVSSYAATTTRWGQRIVIAVAVQMS